MRILLFQLFEVSKTKMKLCNYGCGQEAKYQFKNDKWCCSENQNSCPEMKRKNSEKLKGENNPNYGKKASDRTRKKISESHKGRKVLFEDIVKLIKSEGYSILTTKNEYYLNLPKISFKCPLGHKFNMRLDCFISMGQRCPECARKRVTEYNRRRMIDGGAAILGNKLRTPFKKVKSFVEKQGYILLSDQTEYKNQYSYLRFKCSEGHIFKKRYDGFLAGYRCRKCDNERRKQEMLNGKAAYLLSFVTNPSKPQVDLFNLTKSIYPSAVLNYPSLNFSIDIAIPNLNIAIEYDGSYWHKNKKSDLKRQEILEKEGWKFLRYIDNVPSLKKLKKDINLLNRGE
jgi:hypothetical protein